MDFMRILFYSTSSNIYEGKDFDVYDSPSCADELIQLAHNYPEHHFIVATQRPGMFMLDLKGSQIIQKAPEIEYHIIEWDKETEIADFLESLNPDIAVAASFYDKPLDWFSVKDSIVADYLRQKNIRTICHPVDASLACFDKQLTHRVLERASVRCPKSVYIHHALFINAGNRPQIKSNVYKTAVYEQLKALRYPVVIKDTVGLSSYGMEVVQNFEEARNFLLSKRNTSDRIAEEMIFGQQAGVELVSTPKKIIIEKPFFFSVNKYGITSPKQSVKAGPVKHGYKIAELNSMLKKMCRALNFYGPAQVDLVFDGKDWYVIEINPRLSGMSTTCAFSQGLGVLESLFEKTVLNKKRRSQLSINIKFNLLTEDELIELKKYGFVKKVHQIKNLAALQLREMGYCEVVITAKNKKELLKNLEAIKNAFPQKIENAFIDSARELIQKL